MPEITVLSVPLFSTLCNEAFRLRRAVFIDEQNVPDDLEFDAEDLTAHHVAVISGGEVAGTLRVMHAGEHVKIGRVAVGSRWRRLGIASAMMRFALDTHRDVSANRFYLTAQADKTALYGKFGFVAYGEEFLDAGIPHLTMKNY